MAIKKIIPNYCLPQTYGLVVCGGNSSRMGTDKSLLTYYKKPQRYHVYDMLRSFCESVFISCNELQAAEIDAGYSFLKDDAAYNNIGPMAGLLTAFDHFPGKDILLVGCDYPFLTAAELGQFLIYCKEQHHVSAFYNEQENLYEPLLAWYPYQSFEKLKKMHEAHQFSLQHFLKDAGAVKFYPENKNSITSVDTHEDFIRAKEMIRDT